MNFSANISNMSLQTTSFPSIEHSSTYYTTQTSNMSYTSILSSESVPLFWICAIYAVSAFIYGLLYFCCETIPAFKFNGIKIESTASIKKIWSESLKHSTLNNQQFIVDIIDVIIDIVNSINIYLFYFDTYYFCGITTFIGMTCLTFLIYVKWMLLKYSLLNRRIFDDMINFDLLTATINATQACVAFYIWNQNQIKWNIIMFVKVILVAYLMTIKLGRAVLICITKTSRHYEKNNVKQIMLVDKDKIISSSNEKEQIIESKEIQIEMADYMNISVNIDSEESKQSNQESEANWKKILTEINSFGQFEETKQLLINLSKNNDFGSKYEKEWIRNVILLIKENQKKLRNKAMKPVVKEYVKSLEQENGDDYVKFMALLQNKKTNADHNENIEIHITC